MSAKNGIRALTALFALSIVGAAHADTITNGNPNSSNSGRIAYHSNLGTEYPAGTLFNGSGLVPVEFKAGESVDDATLQDHDLLQSTLPQIESCYEDSPITPLQFLNSLTIIPSPAAPEPRSIFLFGSGLLAFAFLFSRRFRRG